MERVIRFGQAEFNAHAAARCAAQLLAIEAAQPGCEEACRQRGADGVRRLLALRQPVAHGGGVDGDAIIALPAVEPAQGHGIGVVVLTAELDAQRGQ